MILYIIYAWISHSLLKLSISQPDFIVSFHAKFTPSLFSILVNGVINSSEKREIPNQILLFISHIQSVTINYIFIIPIEFVPTFPASLLPSSFTGSIIIYYLSLDFCV